MSTTGTAYPYGLPASLTVKFSNGSQIDAPLVDAPSALKFFGSADVINGLSALYDAGKGHAGTDISEVIANDSGKQIGAYSTVMGIRPNQTDFPIGVLFVSPYGARYLRPAAIEYVASIPSTTPTLTPPTGAPGVWWIVTDATGKELWQISDKALVFAYLGIYGGGTAASNGQWPNVGVRSA